MTYLCTLFCRNKKYISTIKERKSLYKSYEITSPKNKR